MSAMLRTGAIILYELMTRRRFLDRLDELNHTQWLSRDELMAVQREKLHRLLSYAAEHVPYYRRTFDQAGFKPGEVLSDASSLRKLPVLTKSIIRENLHDMLTTGGSTGQPLVFMQDNSFRDYVTADTHRHLGWAGWQFGQPHAYIWGASFEVATSQAFRIRLMDWALNRFLTNAYVLSEESLGEFAARIRRQKPRILFGYASSLHRFAQFAQARGYDDITFDGIFSSA
jgi:phenylacetate-CoA ligase